MVNVNRRTGKYLYTTPIGVPGVDPGEPDPKVGVMRLTGADLVDPDDPALGEIFTAAMELSAFGYDVNEPEVAARIIEVGRERFTSKAAAIAEHRARLEAKEADRLAKLEDAVVYYMRIGNRVKIGWSTDVESRKAVINPEEVMVTEPGDHRLEGARHRQFKVLRTHGEWFKLEDPLTSHIEMLRRHVDK